MEPAEALKAAIDANDAAGVARVLEAHPEVKARLDEALPGASFGQTALLAAVHHENREMVDALLRGRAWPLTFDDMLTALSRDEAEVALKQELAVTLMGHARANPDTIRGRPMPVIVYDPSTGRDAFAVTMRKIRE